MHLSVEASLKKLRTDYIDILYVHWWDFATPIEEVMNGLHNLVAQGKVLYLVWVYLSSDTFLSWYTYSCILHRVYQIHQLGWYPKQTHMPNSPARLLSLSIKDPGAFSLGTLSGKFYLWSEKKVRSQVYDLPKQSPESTSFRYGYRPFQRSCRR